MAYAARIYVDFVWIGEGMGTTSVVTPMANNPELGAAPNAQTMRFQQFELVTPATADVPTAAELVAAITASATDIQTQITAPVLAQIQGWKTGNP